MRWRGASNAHKRDTLMMAALLVTIVTGLFIIVGICVAAILYAPWPFKVVCSLFAAVVALVISASVYDD